MSRRLAGSLLLLFVVACSSVDRSGGIDSGVRGVVVSGPQCPVESLNSPCPDRPWLGTVEAARAGDVVDQRTDANGRFELRLTPGTWTLTPVIEGGGPPTAKPVTVRVEPHRFEHVTLTVDTGIR
jgi:hypothetical protein